MVHFCNSVSDEHSTGPDNSMFKKLKTVFDCPHFNYNQTELIKFDWKAVRGTFLEKAAQESLNFCQEYITKGKENKDFIREDRNELAELVVSYLSQSSVTLRKPGAVHHARFLSKALYYLKLQLLSSQIEFVNQNNKLKTEIRLISEFIVCFYAKWYLQANDAINAPFLDIKAIHQMQQYRKLCAKPDAVDAVLNSLYRLSWYLDSTIIPLALLDDDLSFEEKANLAKVILTFKMPTSTWYNTKNKSKIDIEDKTKMGNKISENPSSLALLVDEFSYLIFDIIGLEEQRIKYWLSLPPEYWFTQSVFKNFQNFAKSLIVVNDHSERSVGMMQQFIHRYDNEEDKQNTLLTVEKVWCAFRTPGRRSNKLSKSKFIESLSSLNKRKKSGENEQSNNMKLSSNIVIFSIQNTKIKIFFEQYYDTIYFYSNI
ncbi:uncharacterized protein LOC136093876 [Hydra vulgaris]|uniref:uncharacterized protein LOC136093876 n=1 Tax=Hydra vulgaris TaxID=6087 RepID=UPI0032EA7E5A